MKKKFLFLFLFMMISIVNCFAYLRVVYTGCTDGVGNYDIYNGNDYVCSGTGGCCGIKVGGKGKEVVKFSKKSDIGKKILALDSKFDLNKVTVFGAKENTVKPKQN